MIFRWIFIYHSTIHEPMIDFKFFLVKSRRATSRLYPFLEETPVRAASIEVFAIL